jgi:hypothetical protein
MRQLQLQCDPNNRPVLAKMDAVLGQWKMSCLGHVSSSSSSSSKPSSALKVVTAMMAMTIMAAVA